MKSNPRAAYLGASVSTASPSRLLVMLCDRLVLDVTRALRAQDAGDHAEAHRQLLHAQDIVTELRVSLAVDEWDGGPRLAAVYDFVHAELVRANTHRDRDRTDACLRLVSDIADMWRETALRAAGAVLPGTPSVA